MWALLLSLSSWFLNMLSHLLFAFSLTHVHVFYTMQRLDAEHVMFTCILGDFRFEYEYEIEYENDFSILLCRLHIITAHTHFIPWTTPLCLHPTGRTRALETSLIWKSKIVLNLVLVVQSKAPYCYYLNGLSHNGFVLREHFKYMPLANKGSVTSYCSLHRVK